MPKYLCLLILVFLPALAAAAATPPAEGIQKYAETTGKGAYQNFGLQPVHDNPLLATFMADRFEYQWREHGIETLVWDAQGWFGNDDHKLYLKSEGEVRLDDGEEVEEADVELLYSRPVDKFWDMQVGLRHDFEPQPERTFLALGLQGMAPQRFEVDATAYLSEDGDVSAKIEVEYELLLTQRLALVPRLETHVSLQDVPAHEEWQGITDVTLGLRALYHLRREFAPYLGVSWSRKLGETANRIESSGGDIDSAAFVAGVRFWF